jgi:hypothetical protein
MLVDPLILRGTTRPAGSDLEVSSGSLWIHIIKSYIAKQNDCGTKRCTILIQFELVSVGAIGLQDVS